jgi:hypothetical protein
MPEGAVGPVVVGVVVAGVVVVAGGVVVAFVVAVAAAFVVVVVVAAVAGAEASWHVVQIAGDVCFPAVVPVGAVASNEAEDASDPSDPFEPYDSCASGPSEPCGPSDPFEPSAEPTELDQAAAAAGLRPKLLLEQPFEDMVQRRAVPGADSRRELLGQELEAAELALPTNDLWTPEVSSQ